MLQPPLVGESPVEGPRRLLAYMEECRGRVVDEIREIVPRDARAGGLLYELMLDYPLRGGKALRPALCIATCRALGGHLESVLRSSAVLELYHNAFLIHDDVEDGSDLRRNQRTLHRLHGVPIAVNVGDGMLALTMEPLLENIELVGLGRALRILRVVARMARESAEGQMMELDWVRRADWSPADRSYLRMVYKKTCWYTFIAPVLVGGIAAGARESELADLARFVTPLGIAFQIQDDVLNLVGEASRYGKEIDGDLWEGKHTLLLIHAVRRASHEQRREALRILSRPRPGEGLRAGPVAGGVKSEQDVAFLRELVLRGGGVDYARAVARRHADRARRSFERIGAGLPGSVHRDFLESLVDFVVARDR
jgi:geranylgeranyl diphosphate synthase type II